jgi:hypothetical protein
LTRPVSFFLIFSSRPPLSFFFISLFSFSLISLSLTAFSLGSDQGHHGQDPCSFTGSMHRRYRWRHHQPLQQLSLSAFLHSLSPSRLLFLSSFFGEPVYGSWVLCESMWVWCCVKIKTMEVLGLWSKSQEAHWFGGVWPWVVPWWWIWVCSGFV